MTVTPGRSRVTDALEDVAKTALGQAHRDDVALPRSGGPAGNARLTAWTGLVLLVLFLVECATLAAVRQTISVHILVGAAMLPLVVLKTATTGWRIIRYYAGASVYRRAGPPPLLLRVLGPLVVLTGLAVIGSGLALIPLGSDTFTPLLTVLGQRIDALTVHQICFGAWLVVVGVHTLVRLVPALRLVSRRTRPVSVDGGPARGWVLVASVAAGAAVGILVLNASSAWTQDRIVRPYYYVPSGGEDH